jgi:hypothetical protein
MPMRKTISAFCLLLSAFSCSPKPEASETAKTTSDETAVSMPQETAKQNGITVVALQEAHATSVAIGNATVVDVTDLVNSASQYAAALAQRDQASAHLQASRATLARLRTLNTDARVVSDQAVQDAAAAAASDEANVRAADVSARAAETAARQKWGATLAHGIINNAPWARQLTARESVLVEVAFTNEGPAPAQIQINGVAAQHLAVSPRVDARLQKPVHDYIAPAAELPVGLITTINAPLASHGGVLVPKDAIVWNGPQALVFVEDKPGHYVQHPIDARTPLDNGFLETSLTPGTRVVTTGAQQLLSEQHKPEVE